MHLVVDTRGVKFHELISSVNNADPVVILSRDLIIVKYQVRTYLLPMPYLPDAVIDSYNVNQIVPVILPIIKFWLIFSVVLFMLVFKTTEVAFFGLVTFVLRRGSLVRSLTFKESVNLATVAMIPPVAVHCVIVRSEPQMLDRLLVYFGVYILVLTTMIIAVGPDRGR